MARHTSLTTAVNRLLNELKAQKLTYKISSGPHYHDIRVQEGNRYVLGYDVKGATCQQEFVVALGTASDSPQDILANSSRFPYRLQVRESAAGASAGKVEELYKKLKHLLTVASEQLRDYSVMYVLPIDQELPSPLSWKRNLTKHFHEKKDGQAWSGLELQLMNVLAENRYDLRQKDFDSLILIDGFQFIDLGTRKMMDEFVSQKHKPLTIEESRFLLDKFCLTYHVEGSIKEADPKIREYVKSVLRAGNEFLLAEHYLNSHEGTIIIYDRDPEHPMPEALSHVVGEQCLLYTDNYAMVSQIGEYILNNGSGLSRDPNEPISFMRGTVQFVGGARDLYSRYMTELEATSMPGDEPISNPISINAQTGSRTHGRRRRTETLVYGVPIVQPPQEQAAQKENITLVGMPAVQMPPAPVKKRR